MKSINIVRTDDYTYSFEETLFVTNDPYSPEVHTRLQKDFVIDDEKFFKLNCDLEITVKEHKGGLVKLTISDVEVVSSIEAQEPAND